jgi:hypothetical protein
MSGILQQLGTLDTWGVVLVVAVFGAAGSLIHHRTTDGLTEAWWQSALIGIVAAVGLAAFTKPATGVELIGSAALAGFFARSLLAALESRIKLELTRQQADRAMALANDALELSRRSRTPNASSPADIELGRLSARLDEVRAASQATARGRASAQ